MKRKIVIVVSVFLILAILISSFVTLFFVRFFDDDYQSQNQQVILTHDEMKEDVIEYFESGGNITNISTLDTTGWTISHHRECPNQTSIYMYNNRQVWIKKPIFHFAGFEFRCSSVKDIPEEIENESEMVKQMEERTLIFNIIVHPLFSEEDHIFFQEFIPYQKSSYSGDNCEILCETDSLTIVYFSAFIGNELDPKLGPMHLWG